jgi:probable rRNA maturation factor
MRAMNRAYRAQDCATDVLSFPLIAGNGQLASPRGRQPMTGRRHGVVAGRFLGDIVIARGVAARQAREAGHPLGVELRILSLHGLLHLLGYDHDRDAGRMARLERRLRRQGGLREGLIERGRRR